MIDFLVPYISKGTVRWLLRLAAKVLTAAIYILALISAYGGYFNPEWWTLPAIGVLFFPYFAMATLACAALWIFNRKYIIGCVGIGVLLACGPTFSEALPFRFGNKTTDPERTFKMVTFNCLHMRDTQDPGGTDWKVVPEAETNRSIEFLMNSGADFICLQEMYWWGKPEIPDKYQHQVDELLKIYPFYSLDGWREVEFISKFPFQQIDVELGEDVKYGSCAAYKLSIDGHKLTVINVHLPSYLLSDQERKILTQAGSEEGMKNSIREFEGTIYDKMKYAFANRAKVSKAIAEFADKQEGNVIVCGDFNDVPGSWAYRNFTKRGFEDAYSQTGFGHLITYNEHMMWFHIDQILYRGALIPLYVRKERMDASDHYPIVAEFEFI